MILRRLSYVVGLFIAIIIATAFFWHKFLTTPLTIKTPTLFVISPGERIEQVATHLQMQGFTRYPMLIIWLARWQGSDKHLKIGEYELKPGMTPPQVLANIVKGKVFLRHYTLVEGWTFKQSLAALNSNSFLKHTLIDQDPAVIAKKLGLSYSVEGLLNPDTYLFARGIADIVIVKKALRAMQNNLDSLWPRRDVQVPFNNPYMALIAASLIEKETAQPSERARIAGVIIRRLQQGMRLQIDASVIYGLGNLYQGKLTHDDIKIDTPYNTYLHSGLPPTPIAMPSKASLYAALHPATGTELFYVARGDGTHEFSATLTDHIAAIKRFRPAAPVLIDIQKQEASDPTTHPLFPRGRWDEQLLIPSLSG